jgi:hypothetical protein
MEQQQLRCQRTGQPAGQPRHHAQQDEPGMRHDSLTVSSECLIDVRGGIWTVDEVEIDSVGASCLRASGLYADGSHRLTVRPYK